MGDEEDVDCVDTSWVVHKHAVTLQKNVRRYLAVKQYRPRYQGHECLRRLMVTLHQMHNTHQRMGMTMEGKQIASIIHVVQCTMKCFKTATRMDPQEVDMTVTQLVLYVGKLIRETIPQPQDNHPKTEDSFTVRGEESDKGNGRMEQLMVEKAQYHEVVIGRHNRLSMESLCFIQHALETEEKEMAKFKGKLQQIKHNQNLALHLSSESQANISIPLRHRSTHTQYARPWSEPHFHSWASQPQDTIQLLQEETPQSSLSAGRNMCKIS